MSVNIIFLMEHVLIPAVIAPAKDKLISMPQSFQIKWVEVHTTTKQ